MIHKVRKLEILMIIVHVGEGEYWILFCNLKKKKLPPTVREQPVPP